MATVTDAAVAEAVPEGRCPADRKAGFTQCEIVWRFGSRAGMELLGGALAGDTAGLLGVHDSRLYLWIVSRDGRVVALSLDARQPAKRQPVNEPVLSFRAIGSVVATDDRFLVAFGGMDEQWVWVWVRAFLPPAGMKASPSGFSVRLAVARSA
ncbi:MAG: hypothetical protein HY907_19070 [Deltaproteobacteria bacterium]|nr:hypothetical protein [Deltaproteobacteria bacterium]